jgi:hypothetical protein
MPIIIVTWEIETGGLWFEASPKKSSPDPTHPIAGHSGVYLSSQTTQEAEIERIVFTDKYGQNKF